VALVIGAVILVDTDAEAFAISEPLIAAKAVVGAVVTYLIVYLTRGSFRARIVSGQEELVDAKARVIDWHDGDGHVWLHGERWKAEEPRDLGPDDQVRVREVTGLVVRVDPLPKND
jgi:membrane-bound serine protease (ClpP class)